MSSPSTHHPGAVPALRAPELQAAARALGTAGGGGQLLALLYDPDVELDAVVAALNREPALAARVLKVANSPFYRAAGSVGTLDRALALLGLTAIRGIAAAGCLDRMTPAPAGTAFDAARFRRHSLAVALGAQHFARAAGLPFAGEAFMAGLLHDIGVLVLVKAAPAALAAHDPAALAERAAREGVPPLALEREALGATHEEAAAALAQSWSLPGWLQAAATGHHAGPAGADSAAGTLEATLPRLLQLGNEAACAAGFPLWPGCDEPAPADALSALGLEPAARDAALAMLPEAVSRLGA